MKFIQIFCIYIKRKIIPYRFSKIKSGVLKNYLWKNQMLDNSCFLGTYEESTIRVIEKIINKNDICYDVGANVGYLTMAISKITGSGGHVYCFEAFPDNHQKIIEHIEKNKIKNITPFSLALSAKTGTLQFTNSGNHVANTYISKSPIFNNSKKITVRCDSIDNLVRSQKIQEPQFIKIDVEGAEYDVLIGAENTIKINKPNIFIATHNNHNPGVREKCLHFLNANNYSIKLINSSSDNQMEDFICRYEKSK